MTLNRPLDKDKKRQLPSLFPHDAPKRNAVSNVDLELANGNTFCKECKKDFSRPSSLRRHLQSLHAATARFTCDFEGCGYNFTRRDTRDRHKATMHGSAKSPCPQCGAAIRKDALSEHMGTKSCQESPFPTANRLEYRQRPQSHAQHGQLLPSHESALPSNNDITPHDQQAFGDAAEPVPVSNAIPTPFDTQASESNEQRASQNTHEPTPVLDDPGAYSRRSISDPLFSDQRLSLSELISEVATWDRIVLPEPLISPLSNGKISQICDSTIQTQVAKKDSKLGVILAHCGVRSYRKLKRVDFDTVCVLCHEMIGATSAEVIRHARDHVLGHEEKKFSCRICNVRFAYSRDFRSHGKWQMNCIPPLDCSTPRPGDGSDWVAELSELDRNQYIDGLRRWELLQLHGYLSRLVRLLARHSHRKLRHNTTGVIVSKTLSAAPRCQRRPTPVKSQARTMPLDVFSKDESTKLTHLLQGLQLKDPPEYADERANKRRMNHLPSHSLFYTRQATYDEKFFLKACLVGDITNAGRYLLRIRREDSRQLIQEACGSAIYSGQYEVVSTLLTRSADLLRGPFRSCLNRQEENLIQHCSEHKDLGHVYKAMLDIVFSQDAFVMRQILPECDSEVLQVICDYRRSNDSLLVLCARDGRLDALRYLIQLGIPADWYLNSCGMTALHEAAMFGHVDIALELLGAGANIDEPDASGQTPLWRAVSMANHGMVGFLLSHGASVALRGSFHSKLCAQLRSDAGVQVVLPKWTEEPLWSVASRHSDIPLELLYRLLPGRHSVNIVDADGLTALHRVCIEGRTDLARILLAGGAGIEQRDRLGATPLIQVAKQTSTVDHTQSLRLLISEGASINARDSMSRTALMWAAQRGDCNEVDILIRNGADVNAVAMGKDSEGPRTAANPFGCTRYVRYTALTLAASTMEPRIQREMIDLLLDHGADAELLRELLQK